MSWVGKLGFIYQNILYISDLFGVVDVIVLFGIKVLGCSLQLAILVEHFLGIPLCPLLGVGITVGCQIQNAAACYIGCRGQWA